MTRISLVHSFYASSAPSGENVAVELQAAALREAGHEVTVMAVATDELALHRWYRARTAVGVATGRGVDPSRRLRASRPDVVHVHNLFPNFSTRWLADWDGPLVATIHNYRPMCAAGTLARGGAPCVECVGRVLPVPAIRHRCYKGSAVATLPLAVATAGGVGANPVLRRADHVIFLAPRARRIYADAGFTRPGATSVLPNFVEASPEAPVATAERHRRPWLYFGRLAPEKGVLRMLRAWPSEVPLHVYGGGPDEAEIARVCGGSVEFKGASPRDELLHKLPYYRGLIFPTMFAEGLPTVYLESLAAGLPVIARAGNSAADDVAMYGTGVVFERFEELPEAVERLNSDYGAHVASARRRYHEGYSPSAWIHGVEGIYRQVIDRRGGRLGL